MAVVGPPRAPRQPSPRPGRIRTPRTIRGPRDDHSHAPLAAGPAPSSRSDSAASAPPPLHFAQGSTRIELLPCMEVVAATSTPRRTLPATRSGRDTGGRRTPSGAGASRSAAFALNPTASGVGPIAPVSGRKNAHPPGFPFAWMRQQRRGLYRARLAVASRPTPSFRVRALAMPTSADVATVAFAFNSSDGAGAVNAPPVGGRKGRCGPRRASTTSGGIGSRHAHRDVEVAVAGSIF